MRIIQRMVEQTHCCVNAQRIFDPATIALARLVQTWRAKEDKDNLSTEPSLCPPKCTAAEDLPETMEDIEVWLLSNCGDTKTPLGYVTREHAEVPERRNPPEPDCGHCMPTALRRMNSSAELL